MEGLIFIIVVAIILSFLSKFDSQSTEVKSEKREQIQSTQN